MDKSIIIILSVIILCSLVRAEDAQLFIPTMGDELAYSVEVGDLAFNNYFVYYAVPVPVSEVSVGAPSKAYRGNEKSLNITIITEELKKKKISVLYFIGAFTLTLSALIFLPDKKKKLLKQKLAEQKKETTK